MGTAHKDRLSALDASFLHQERGGAHMHVGLLTVFEGPAPAYEEYLAQVGSRLDQVPRYRQRLATPRLRLGGPVWIDDPAFSLEYHVRHTALPAPGSTEQLRILIARIFSQGLDRTKPLWENWLVKGLDPNRWAIISKAHHALVDGVGGADLLSVLFDFSPIPPEADGSGAADGGGGSWRPAAKPSEAELALGRARSLAGAPLRLGARTLEAARNPGQAADEALEVAEGMGELAWAVLNPAPETPLNVEIGPHRRLAWTGAALADFKEVKDALGGTVNDAVLAVVAGALARWLKRRGVQTAGLELRALVPVSLRTEDQQGALGNRLAAMRARLPVYVDDPVERLHTVIEQMGDLKESKQALGAEAIVGAGEFAPPTLLAQASRINFSTRLFNLIVTNVPGPQVPLYLLGRELQQLVPVAFLPENHALAIAIMSYNGRVEFGLLGDYDALPDLERLGQELEDSLAELVEAARNGGSGAAAGDSS